MADITLGYIPTNGLVFNPTGWNTDMWSSTNGISIYGELNGHIQEANFAGGQQVDARHIRQFEGFRAEWSGDRQTQDWYQLVFSPTYSEAAFVMLPGCAKRVYIPWGSGATNMFHVSAFASNYRMRQATSPEPQAIELVNGPEMYVAMFVDGAMVAHSLRSFPTTWYPSNLTGAAKTVYTRESVMTQHYDLVDFRNALDEGWHDVALGLLILPNTGVEKLYPLYDGGVSAVNHSVMHRIRFGIRAASIVCLP